MKRRVDLNEPGAKAVPIIALFMIVIPALIFLLSLIFGYTHLNTGFLASALRISLSIGVILTLSLVSIIVIEHFQDRVFDWFYRRQQGHKVLLEDGSYECQFCGSQKVHEFDQICPVCGHPFAEPKP